MAAPSSIVSQPSSVELLESPDVWPAESPAPSVDESSGEEDPWLRLPSALPDCTLICA